MDWKLFWGFFIGAILNGAYTQYKIVGSIWGDETVHHAVECQNAIDTKFYHDEYNQNIPFYDLAKYKAGKYDKKIYNWFN